MIAVEAPGGRGDGEDRRGAEGASSPAVTRGPAPTATGWIDRESDGVPPSRALR